MDTLLFTLLVLSSSAVVIGSEKILVLSNPFISHTRKLHLIGEKLASRGHDVYSLLLDQQDVIPVEKLPMEGIKPIFFAFSGINASLIDQTLIDYVTEDKLPTKLPSNILWEYILRSNVIMNTLRDHKFNLAIVDIFFDSKTIYLVPHVLSVKYVEVIDSLHVGGIANLHVPTSYHFSRSKFTMTGLTHKMPYFQRVLSFFHHIIFINQWLVSKENKTLLQEFSPGYSSFEELREKSLLHFITRDHILTQVRGQMPNIIRTPGWSIKPANKLPDNLRIIADNSDKVIVMSFGSSVMSHLSEDNLNTFLTAFSQVNYTVFIRTDLDPQYKLSVPDNVHILKWLPQNDLLGHRNTKLFISHCGINGEYEAVYHGVPIIGFPICCDQFSNCAKLQDEKIGVCMNILDFTWNQLVRHINEVGADGSIFHNNTKSRSSLLMDTDARPLDTVAWWIEHVLKHGGQHLRSHTLEMPWYEYWMVDIFIFVAFVFITIAVILIIFLVLAWNQFTKKTKQD